MSGKVSQYQIKVNTVLLLKVAMRVSVAAIVVTLYRYRKSPPQVMSFIGSVISVAAFPLANFTI